MDKCKELILFLKNLVPRPVNKLTIGIRIIETWCQPLAAFKEMARGAFLEEQLIEMDEGGLNFAVRNCLPMITKVLINREIVQASETQCSDF